MNRQLEKNENSSFDIENSRIVGEALSF